MNNKVGKRREYTCRNYSPFINSLRFYSDTIYLFTFGKEKKYLVERYYFLDVS